MEAYVAFSAESPGEVETTGEPLLRGALDSGCQRTVMGQQVFEAFVQQCTARGEPLKYEQDVDMNIFRFGDGKQKKGMYSVKMQLCLFDKPLTLRASIIDGEDAVPVLARLSQGHGHHARSHECHLQQRGA